MEDKKKKSTKDETPGINKKKFSRIKQEYFDMDYLNKLSPEEKKWMSDFMYGHLGANTKDNPLFEEYADKKVCWDANNARNRDVYSRSKVLGKLVDIAIIEEPITEYEDELIDCIDEGIEIGKLVEE